MVIVRPKGVKGWFPAEVEKGAPLSYLPVHFNWPSSPAVFPEQNRVPCDGKEEANRSGAVHARVGS
jgi:hypothetical protein